MPEEKDIDEHHPYGYQDSRHREQGKERQSNGNSLRIMFIVLAQAPYLKLCC